MINNCRGSVYKPFLAPTKYGIGPEYIQSTGRSCLFFGPTLLLSYCRSPETSIAYQLQEQKVLKRRLRSTQPTSPTDLDDQEQNQHHYRLVPPEAHGHTIRRKVVEVSKKDHQWQNHINPPVQGGLIIHNHISYILSS